MKAFHFTAYSELRLCNVQYRKLSGNTSLLWKQGINEFNYDYSFEYYVCHKTLRTSRYVEGDSKEICLFFSCRRSILIIEVSMDMWNIMVFVAVSVKLILLCITYAIVINIDSIESHSGANSVTTLPWVELECDNYLEVLNKWKIKFRHAYVDNLEHNMEMHCSRWLEHADNQISKQYLSTIREIDELRRGRLDDCLRQGSSSKYVQIASQWNIEDVISNLISEENQYVLISFAQELFNKQLYSHAEAIAYLLLRNGIEDENSHCINRNSDSLNGSEACKRLVLTNEYTIARMTSSLYVILSEVAKVKGLLETANIASQILIYSFQLVSLQQKAIHGVDYIVDRSGWISWIYRLRSILSIPHVPLSFERAISDRKTMLTELSAFVRDIRQINLTISLSVTFQTVVGIVAYYAHVLFSLW